MVCLGQFGYQAACSHFGVRPRPKFGHGVEVPIDAGPTLICSFHPSQQNTFTKRLTEPMLDAVFARAIALSHPAAVTTLRCASRRTPCDEPNAGIRSLRSSLASFHGLR